MTASDPSAAPGLLAGSSEPARRSAVPLGWRGVALAVLAALSLLAYRDLREVGSHSPGNVPHAEAIMFEPSATSPVLILCATAWMFARRWGRIRANLGNAPSTAWGGLVLAAGLALASWAWAVDAPGLLLPSLSLWTVGAALWLGGTGLLRAVWLPAIFLLFAFPLPAAIVNLVVYPLQLAVARTAAWMLEAFGAPPTHLEGDQLAFRGVLFHVIETCSGLRGTLTLLMSAVLYVELFHVDRLRSVLIVAGAPVIGLFTNQIRVLSIVVNPYSAISAVHTAQGLAMIVAGVLLLAVWDGVLGRLLPSPGTAPRRRRPVRRPLSLGRVAGLAAFVAALLSASLFVDPWAQPRTSGRPPLATIAAPVEGASPTSLPIDKDFFGSTQFTEWVHRSYGDGEEAVELFLGADDRSTGGARMLSLKTAVVRPGHSIDERGVAVLASGRRIEWFLLRAGLERSLAWRWHEGVGSTTEELFRSALSLDRSPLRRTDRALAVRLSTPVGSEPDARVRAERRLEDAAARVEASLDAILRSPP